jgi:histidinol-phosphate aminotransferase
MDMPMPSNSERLETALKQIKSEIRDTGGYTSPPQRKVLAKLNQNESPFDLPHSLKENILRDLCYMEWTRYPEHNCLALRAKLALKFELDPGQVVLGNGANALLFTVLTALIQAGDTIVTAPPSFSLFGLVGKIFQGRMVTVPLKPHFTYNRERLLQEVGSAKLTIFSSPCNPTGRCMDLKLLDALLRETEGMILFDEAYGEFHEESAVPMLAQHPNLLVMRTFSKAMGLAGARIGYLLANPRIAAELQKAAVPYNLNLFAIQAALRVLDIPQWTDQQIGKILEERRLLWDGLNGIPGVEPYPTDTNFILFRVADGPAVLKELEDRGVLIRDMGGYDQLKNCLRVTVGTPQENTLFLDALREILCGNRAVKEGAAS